MNTIAWHIARNGKVFETSAHLYVEQDEDLYSEAQCSALLLKAGASDTKFLNTVIDLFLGFVLIENEENLQNVFEDDFVNFDISELYPFDVILTNSEIIAIHKQCNNYNSWQQLKTFLRNSDITNISNKVEELFNNFFCRARYGGMYDVDIGDSELYFRISSTDGFNWANIVYKFVAENYKKLRVEYVTVVRDAESDKGFGSYSQEYYRAKDGVTYNHMPIEEFLSGEHENRMYFEKYDRKVHDTMINENLTFEEEKELSEAITSFIKNEHEGVDVEGVQIAVTEEGNLTNLSYKCHISKSSADEDTHPSPLTTEEKDAIVKTVQEFLQAAYDDDDVEMDATCEFIDSFTFIIRAHIDSAPLEEAIELGTAEQEFNSAATSINSSKLPAIFKLVHFRPNTINIDYGGGKFDNAAEALAKQDVTNLVYDPFNRSKEHNDMVLDIIEKNGGADSATCSNVLNVIKEPEARRNVLENISKLVKPNGDIYITVYEGSGSAEGKVTKSGYQLNRKTADYLEEIRQVFPDAERKGKLIIASNNKNRSNKLEEDYNEADKHMTDIVLSEMINNAIKSEWDAISIYTGLLNTSKELGQDVLISNLQDIISEEYKHVGQLQELLKLVDSTANVIETGEQEGIAKIEDPDAEDVSVDNDADDEFDDDYGFFDVNLTEARKAAPEDMYDKVVNSLVKYMDVGIDTRKYPFNERKNERYRSDQIIPGRDSLDNILVVANSKDDLSLAKDVADYFDLDYKYLENIHSDEGNVGIEIIIPEESIK